MMNAPESGVERTKREKEQKKSDSIKVEIKWKFSKFESKNKIKVICTKGERKEKTMQRIQEKGWIGHNRQWKRYDS